MARIDVLRTVERALGGFKASLRKVADAKIVVRQGERWIQLHRTFEDLNGLLKTRVLQVRKALSQQRLGIFTT